MHEEMRSAKMIDDALRVFKTEGYLVSPSQFHNFDYDPKESRVPKE